MFFRDSLAATSSTNDKLEILKSMATLDTRAFEYAYNRYKIYGIKKFDFIDMDNLGEPSEAMFEALDAVLNKEVVGNSAREYIEDVAFCEGDLIKLIVTKDMRCGVSETLLNKAYHKLLPVYKIQKAKVVNPEDLVYPIYSQLKYDGIRLTAIKNNKRVSLHTSSGKLTYFPKLIAELEDSTFFKNGVLDGELIYKDGSMKHRANISGLNTSAMRGKEIDETDVSFQVFDIMSVTAFEQRHIINSLTVRMDGLKWMLTNGFKDSVRVKLAETETLYNSEGVSLAYNKVIANGFEGLILKYPNRPYEFKKSDAWVKLKEAKDADLMCIGTTEGTGQYEGHIGSLICEGEVEDKDVFVDVGGLTRADRLKDPSEFIGQTVEIIYNSVIQDKKTKLYSLFLPRFSRVRHDK